MLGASSELSLPVSDRTGGRGNQGVNFSGTQRSDESKTVNRCVRINVPQMGIEPDKR